MQLEPETTDATTTGANLLQAHDQLQIERLAW